MLRITLTALSLILAGCATTPQPTPQAPPTPPTTSAPAPRTSPEVRTGKWKVRDTQLFVRDVGPKQAPVLLVLHGGPGGNHTSLRPLEALSPAYRVVLYDQRGTGESERLAVSPKDPASLQRLSLEENVEDIEALRKQLGRETISLIGHSWGGALAVFYAAAYPRRIDKLIVYSGGPETRELARRKKVAHNAKLTPEERAQLKQRMGALIGAVKTGAPQRDLDAAFVKLASVMFPSLNCERPIPAKTGHGGDIGRGGFWANQALGAYVETFTYSLIADKLKQLSAPTLLIWGTCEPSPKERLANLLDYLPDARLVIFDKSGHNAMEEQRGLFFDCVRSFLKGKALPMKAYKRGMK